METKEFRLGPNDTIVGMDLGSIEHQVVIKDTRGKRLTRKFHKKGPLFP